MRNFSFRAVLDITSAFAMLGASALIAWAVFTRETPPLPRTEQQSRTHVAVPAEPISLVGAQTVGSTTAKIALVEFSDFECPFCGRAAREVLPIVKRRHVESGEALLAFRHLPLPNHQHAKRAAQAAECAASSGKFWEMRTALFTQPMQLDETSIQRHARAIGIPSEKFLGCLKEQPKQIEADMLEAERLGVKATPTYLVGYLRSDGTVSVKKTLVGLITVDVADRIVSELLRATP